MFNETKKILKKNLFLRDKYQYIINGKKNVELVKGEFGQETYVSNMQIRELMTTIGFDNALGRLNKKFEKNFNFNISDLVYIIVFLLLFPVVSSALMFYFLFYKNNMVDLYAYAGTFGSFFIFSFIFGVITSKVYEKLNGNNLKSIKSKRGFNDFCEHLRKEKDLEFLLKVVLNQNRKMKAEYKNITIGKDDQRVLYDRLSPKEFCNEEKKVIISLFNEQLKRK